MRNTAFVIVLAVLGVAAWAGLVLLMNSVPPTGFTKVLFLWLWFLGLFLTATPVAHLANARLAAPLGRRGDLGRSLRQGLLVGGGGAAIMGMQFLRVLTPFVALAVLAGAVVVEVMMQLRTR